MKQIMMKGKQRVKGTVLFTVVTVMMVMVVFLMSTLILTTSANRRSYYTYYQTQAQYAAQAALDTITNSAYNDSGFYSWLSDHRVLHEQLPITITVRGLYIYIISVSCNQYEIIKSNTNGWRWGVCDQMHLNSDFSDKSASHSATSDSL